MVTKRNSIHKDTGLVPGLAQWVKHLALPLSCSVICRHGSDLMLLWLWHRPAAAALIGSLAWEPPYAMDAALKSQKKKKEREREKT